MNEHEDSEFSHGWGTGWTNRGDGGVYAPISQSVNPGLSWAAAVFGGGALFAVLVMAILKPWETADRAVAAELRVEFEQRVSRTEALAELARKEASTAKDITDLEVQRRKAREELKR